MKLAHNIDLYEVVCRGVGTQTPNKITVYVMSSDEENAKVAALKHLEIHQIPYTDSIESVYRIATTRKLTVYTSPSILVIDKNIIEDNEGKKVQPILAHDLS